MTADPPGDVGVVGLDQLVEREAKIVGIHDFHTPTLEAVDRRRSQLWTVAFSALVCLSVGVALLASRRTHTLGFANRAPFRVGTVVLVVALAAYVMEKERHLRRLARLLMEERLLGAALSNRLKELATLYEAGRAMNSVLAIDDVLRLILSSACELLQAGRGSIMLVDRPGVLVLVSAVGAGPVPGTEIPFGDGVAGRVAAERQPLLVQGATPRDTAVCVPLVHRDQLFGVLTLSGSPARVYTQHDVRAVAMFAEHAAIAIANARLYEEERTLAAKLSYQVVHDPLTGVANRMLVHDRLEHALSRLPRTGAHVGVLFIDLDDFKNVNDRFGHEAGDQALSMVARRISASVRPSDTVGRIGGDEFVVVCEDLPSTRTAADIAERIFDALHRPLPESYVGVLLSASIGIATCSAEHPADAEELLRLADRSMYRAKLDGKSRFVAVSG